MQSVITITHTQSTAHAYTTYNTRARNPHYGTAVQGYCTTIRTGVKRPIYPYTNPLLNVYYPPFLTLPSPTAWVSEAIESAVVLTFV